MSVTARFAALTAAVVVFATGQTGADDPATSGPSATPSNATNAAISSLTNKAVSVISKLRGVEPAVIKIRPSGSRAFEIDIDGAKDAAKEAEQLSKEFGPAAAVILEHVSDDGITRTNWTFKGGTVEQITAPAGPSGLGPRARRMYVWPQAAAKPSAPGRVRVRGSI